MNKRTRYKIAILAGLMLFGLAVLSVFKGLESVAVSAIGAFMTILSAYLWAETNRPSK